MKDGEFEGKKDTFDRIIQKFKKSGKHNYHFLTRAGVKFQDTVFKFCHRMLVEEKFPSVFQNTTLHMIFKGGKGNREVLSSNRFVHCKEWWPRAAEGLIVEDGLKEPLLAGSSIYQIGGQPGHRTEEHMFLLKSVLAKYRAEGRMVVIQTYDVAKFFDKEMIEDAILTCLKRGADPKAVRLWHKLNADTNIRVRTGAGMTRYAPVGAVVGQGMLGGALVSQAVLDEGVMEHFSKSNQTKPGGAVQMEYGNVPMSPLLWLDDIINAAEQLEQARIVNEKIDFLMKQRGLCLNQEKSVCIIMGSKKQKKNATIELK